MHVIRDHITQFYKNLLSTTTKRRVSVQSSLWSDAENLNSDQRATLEAPFTLDEISKIVFFLQPVQGTLSRRILISVLSNFLASY